MKTIFALLFACLALTEMSTVNGAARENTDIQAAVQYCEAEVPNYCIQTTCPTFCQSFRTNTQKAKCSRECTLQERCKLNPLNPTGRSTNEALEAQSRDQLAACIAERRDPNNVKTGRRTTPWRDILTPSYQRATQGVRG